MLDLWPRSFADADNCRDFCEHWPELCKPTLITSFLPVPDKRSDTPDNFVGEAKTHPGSLVISLSHRKGQRADKLPRQKLSKGEMWRGRTPNLSTRYSPVMLSIFALVRPFWIRYFILNFFLDYLGSYRNSKFYDAILYDVIFSEVRNFAFFLIHLRNGWTAIFDQTCTMRSSTPWNFEIIFRHAVETTIKTNVGEKYLRWITLKKLRYDTPRLLCVGDDRLVINLPATVVKNDDISLFAGVSIVSLVYSSWFPARAKIQSVRDFSPFLLFRLIVLSGSSRSMFLDTTRHSWLVLRRFKSRSIPSIMTTVIPQILSPLDWFSIDRDSPFSSRYSLIKIFNLLIQLWCISFLLHSRFPLAGFSTTFQITRLDTRLKVKTYSIG